MHTVALKKVSAPPLIASSPVSCPGEKYCCLTFFLRYKLFTNKHLCTRVHTHTNTHIHTHTHTHTHTGFPDGSVVKNLSANARDAGDAGSVPGMVDPLE